MNEDEYLEIVNEKGEIIGSAQRSEIHGNPSLMHKVVHVLVFNREGDLLLQKRSQNKDVAPGKWDTSVGGHVEAGEDLLGSCKREMLEELGDLRCEGTADLEGAERTEGHDVGVVLAHPVDGPVRTGVQDHDIPAGT